MKLRPEELDPHLSRPLRSVYLISGDEPLLVDETARKIRAAARRQGIEERTTFVAEHDFDWQQLVDAGASMSLFADRRLLELRLPGGKPGTDGAAVLAEWAGNPPPDTILVVISPRLDRATRNRAWVKALDQAGAMIDIWPVARERLPAWLEDRARRRGLQISRDAARFIAERVEGNLLAGAQELAKLALLLGESRADDQAVYQAVVDSARYDPFQLADAALGGEAERVVRILDGLHSEGFAPPLILWALAREIRTVADMAAEVERGRRLEEVTRRVWNRRRSLIQKAIQRYSARDWLAVLDLAAEADAVAKGSRPGNIRDTLQRLALSMASPEAARRFLVAA